MDKDRIIKAVKSGMTYAEAAEKFGVSRSKVAGIMHRAGVKVGPRPEKVKKAMKRFMASPEGEKFRRDVAERNRLRWARTPKRERIAHSRMMREARSTT